MDTTKITTTEPEQTKKLFKLVCSVCGNPTYLEKFTPHQLTCPFCRRETLQYQQGAEESIKQVPSTVVVPIPQGRAEEMVQKAKEILSEPKKEKKQATPEELEKATPEICHLNKQGLSQKIIANRYNTSPATVQRICAGTWKPPASRRRNAAMSIPMSKPSEGVDNRVIEGQPGRKEMTPEQKATYFREIRDADPATRRMLHEAHAK
jgi:hypothetical protein